MTVEIPGYGLKAYALLFTRHGVEERFRQSELDWIVSSSMKKKIFALLLKTGWIKKHPKGRYSCTNPTKAIKGLLDFRVPTIIKNAEREYAFTGSSAVEIWSDYSYIQRGIEKSPYFIKILRKDETYWRKFFSKHDIPYYIGSGTTVGEYVVIILADQIKSQEKEEFRVDPLKETMRYAKQNEIYDYAYNYMQHKYGVGA